MNCKFCGQPLPEDSTSCPHCGWGSISQPETSQEEQVFEETGNLWEKYNVVEGNANVITEEKMPPMMGWTAGVYLAFAEHYATAGPNIH